MKVGVIAPVRNALPWIKELSDSVWAQTHPAGLYLAEDWSDDGTYEYLTKNPDLYTKMVRTPARAGWPGGLNYAAELALADGCDAVFTACADDKLHPECIERCARALEGRDFVVPYAQEFGARNNLQRSHEGMTFTQLVEWPLLIDKALIRRHVWETVGGYSIEAMIPGSWGCAEDWEFWIKVWKAGLNRYAVIATVLYYFRIRPGQLSSIRGKLHPLTVQRFKEMHPDLPWSPTSGRWPPVYQVPRPPHSN